jgi:hypothetical protein
MMDEFDEFFEDIDYVTAHFQGHFDNEEGAKEEFKWVFKKWVTDRRESR